CSETRETFRHPLSLFVHKRLARVQNGAILKRPPANREESPAMSPFSTISASVEKVVRRFLSVALLLLLVSPVYGGLTRASGDNPDEKVKKQFYSAKDRLAAMKSASLYESKAVADTNILVGPKQGKKEFQFHEGDKVVCDFKTAGKDMGGKTPKFG